MRQSRLIFALMAGLGGGLVALPALASDHLVAPLVISSRLADARQARQVDLASVEALLETPAAVAVAARLGADATRLRAAVATLDDAELRDLARRTRALRSDPIAGLSTDINDLLVLFLIIAIVVLVLQAVD